MRAVLIRSLAVIAGGGMVLAGVLYVASTVDVRPPSVLAIRLTSPVADDDRVALITTSLEVIFSEPVVKRGAEEAIRLEPSVPGAISWSGPAMTFTPRDPLRLEAPYRLVVEDGIRDAAGNEMTELPPPFEFQTAGRPTLVGSAPANGEEEAPIDAPITLTFSTLMDTTSVEEGLHVTPDFDHDLRWRGEVLEIVPNAPLESGTEYEVEIDAGAADPAGVTIGEPISFSFQTFSPGLGVATLVPADGVDGISPTSPIAVFFDRPIDPGSAGDALTITPELPGTLEVLALPGDPADEDGAGSLLRFTPSGPMPANTTFDVELTAGPTGAAGGTLAGAMTWSFTTGAPSAAISNGIAFVTARGGVDNVWVMNPDGTGQRQVTAELSPVMDYAVAPDGASLVVGDGRHLVYQRADGGDRRVLTAEGLLDFDPAYSPDGRRIAFARADAESGRGLGLWEWSVTGGDPVAIELPASDEPQPAGPAADFVALRAPRYAPDGLALAFVDLAGSVGILELPDGTLTRVPFGAAAPPAWTPDGNSVLLTGRAAADEEAPGQPFTAPVAPLESGPEDSVHRLTRSGTAASELRFGPGSAVLAVGPGGTVAYVDGQGRLRTVERATAIPVGPALISEQIVAAAFAPGELTMVVALAADDGVGPLELVDPTTRERTPLGEEGADPQWLP